ncbi:MAG TPA: hypothetical protein VLI39_20730 [Sedimentisphaerales bacterium]|nr:hypothetical protein [Sedimentisphaerales bacterium]
MRTLRNNFICTAAVLTLVCMVTLADEKLSNTRTASCLVRITLDPAIMPLNPETVENLIASSAVVGQATRKVLGRDPDETGIRQNIEMEWLEGGPYGGAQAGRFSGEQERYSDTQQQLERLYGKDVVGKMLGPQSTPSNKPNSAGDSQPDDRNAPKPQGRQEGAGYGGGYGVMGGGGMGGGMGGMGGMGGGMMGGGGSGGGMMGGMGMGGLGTRYGYRARAEPSRTESVQQSATLRLFVQLPDGVKLAAEEFLNAIVANLHDSLRYAFERYESDLQDVVIRAQAQRDNAAEELSRLLGDGVDPTMVPVDIADLIARRRELTRILQDTVINLEIMNARRRAIEEQIAVTRKELNEKQAGDEIMETLDRIVQNNHELLANLEKQVQAGRAPESEVIKAQENVMKARIELARRREELAKSVGGEQLSRFSNELSQMAIDTAESRARTEMLQQQLRGTQKQLDQVSQFDPKAAAIRVAKETLETAEHRAGELKRRLADLDLNPPMVTVLGAN